MTALLAYDLKNVTKSFLLGPDSITILKGLNLQIPVGQFVSIIGPSGSGKSTLMHLLGCLDGPTDGQMKVLGADILSLTDDQVSLLRGRAIGFVFQSFHLLSCYSAVANVALSMAYTGHPDRWQRAQQLLTAVKLGHRLNHKPRTMSGGEQQRVAIARALANDPPIILADEPTGALDQANGRIILDILDAFHKQGKTIILVTHDMNVARRAQRIVEMMDGQIYSDHASGSV